MQEQPVRGKALATFTLGALGVVYGDIGTSPLYALRECFHGSHAAAPTPANILGVLSLIFWALTLVVSVKYLLIVMRANNRGEGGMLALLALAVSERSGEQRRKVAIVLLGIFGASLLYGDGMITPSITVLGAVEGLKVSTPALAPYVVPISILIIIGLFSVQRFGTGRVGGVFGPITCVWFLVLAVLGLRSILQTPGVLVAANPWYAVHFLTANGLTGFVVLGAVFLVVTGVEALYADMGHFGRRPILLAWFFVVFPALFLNYAGQAALLLREGEAAAENPFFLLAPAWAQYPLVGLATMASIIASQALISGAYSIAMQAVQLGFLPRLEIRHTSSHRRGQVYLPQVNWILMVACVGLVLGFRSSSNLAGAYGIAVSLDMVITSLLFFFVAKRLWQWPAWKACLCSGAFLVIELCFLTSNLTKLFHGGWVALLAAAVIFTLKSTWRTGRAILRQRLEASAMPWNLFIEDVETRPPQRVPGTAVFLSGSPGGTPLALLHNLKHNKILHQRVLLLTVVTEEVPITDPATRIVVDKLPANFWRITCRYGFTEEPDIPELLKLCELDGKKVEVGDATFFLSRETIVPSPRPGMAMWRERLFALMSRNAQSATAFFHLPANRVVELGMQVQV